MLTSLLISFVLVTTAILLGSKLDRWNDRLNAYNEKNALNRTAIIVGFVTVGFMIVVGLLHLADFTVEFIRP